MDENIINTYGDVSSSGLDGFGMDISTQRADDLDNELLSLISAQGGMRVNILDLGCGKGGQTLRMAALNCNVTAVDILDLRAEINIAYKKMNMPKGHVNFIESDIRDTGNYLNGSFHYIYSQRAFHYMCYDDAKKLLTNLSGHLEKGFDPKLFISVSGLLSELGAGYAGSTKNVRERFCQLSPEMAEKHKILLPVCLYTLEEFVALLATCGYTVDKAWQSPFGNIKAVASYRPQHN